MKDNFRLSLWKCRSVKKNLRMESHLLSCKGRSIYE